MMKFVVDVDINEELAPVEKCYHYYNFYLCIVHYVGQ